MSATPALNRVPHIIFLYWVIKIAATTLGETGADQFSMTAHLGYGLTILMFLGLFVVLLAMKLRMARYEPITYWAVFTASAIAGTAISDFLDRTLHLGYAGGSAVLVTILLLVLWLWWRAEKSIDVERITTLPAETWYWIAFLIANTLGTAAGDFTADQLGLGFAASAILFSSTLAVLALLHYFTRISGTLLFWLAFVLTRPFGATFGDFLTKSPDHGGIGFGTLYSSLVFGAVLLMAVWLENRQERARALLAK